MADKTDTSIAAKQDGDASPKADPKAEGANQRTKQRVDPARSSAGTADKQAAKAKRAATAKTRRTRETNDEAA